MPLYTFILDYQGGTYLSQTAAPSPEHAISNWAKSFDTATVPGFSPEMKEGLIQATSEDRLTTVKGISNTWCMGCTIKDRLIPIHIVKTDESTP